MSFIPFRDASQGEADHGISIQDVIWGAWKARRYGLLSLDDDFDAAEYEVGLLLMALRPEGLLIAISDVCIVV